MGNGIFHPQFVYPQPQVPRKLIPEAAAAQVVSPAALDLGLGLPGPTLTAANLVSPAALDLGLALPGPALTQRVLPGALSLGLAQPAPTIVATALPFTEFYAEVDAAGLTDPTLNITNVAWLAGNRVYVITSGKDDDAVVTSVTATGLTFTQVRAQDEATQQQVWMELWESDLAASSDTQTVTVTLDSNPHVGGFMASAIVVGGSNPTTDASNGAETGATDTTTPGVDVTTVAAVTRIFYAFQTRNQTVTLDGGDALTSIRATDFVGTAGNIAGMTLAQKLVASQGTYNGSGTITAIDWVAIGWSVKEGILEVDPPALSLGLALPGPALKQQIAPPALSLGLGQPAPGFIFSFTPPALSLGLALPGPTLTNQVNPGALSLGLALLVPNIGFPIAPAALSLGLALPGPTLKNQINPGALALGLALVNPKLGYSVQPGALPLGLALVNPTLTVAGLSISPAALSLGLTLVTPTINLEAPPVAGLPSVQYVIEILNSGGTFGPNALLGELWDARNIGWSRFDRVPGKAFFTLGQRSALLPLLIPLTTHFRILRLTPTTTKVVWAGIVADTDSTGDDVIVFGYDYLSLLSVSRAGYKTLYPTKLIGTEIVSPEWVLAKGATSSPLGFVTNGTFQDPLGTDGTTPIKTNAQFGTLDQMRLQLFFDLSEMGRANTVNYVTYEITKDTPHTFNFWKNKGSTWAGAFILNGNVREYRYLPNWITYRNDFASVAMTASSGPAEIVKKDASAAAAKGLRQDVFTARTLLGLSGAATEADQQQAALAQQLKRGLQLQPALQIELLRGAYEPGVLGLCDRVPMEIVNGLDNITGSWVFLGETCVVDESGELVNVLVRPLAT